MSDPLWVNAGQGDSIGTATIAAATDLATITAHGLNDGDAIMVDTLTGGAVGVLETGVVYYVRDATANDFAIVSAPGDERVNFTADGGAAVFTAVPRYAADELRRAQGMFLYSDTATRFGARSGVHPSNNPAVTLAGTTWTVENIRAVVHPGLTSLAGPYVVQHPAESGALDPADGTNPRIDALDLQIQDHDEDASGFRRARVVYVVGTPAASPSAPAITATSLRLATILVPAGGTPAPTVTNVARFTVAAGGVLPVRNAIELPTLGLYDGMAAWRRDTNELVVDHDGSGTWETPYGWQVLREGSATNTATIDLLGIGGYSHYRLLLRGHMDTSSWVLVTPNGGLASQSAAVATRASDNAVFQQFWSATSTVWRVAWWSTAFANSAAVDIFNIVPDGANLLGYQGQGVVRSSGAAFHAFTKAGGGINTSATLADIRLQPLSPATLFGSLHWKLLGSR